MKNEKILSIQQSIATKLIIRRNKIINIITEKTLPSETVLGTKKERKIKLSSAINDEQEKEIKFQNEKKIKFVQEHVYFLIAD